MSREKIKYSTLFSSVIKCEKEILNIDFENVIPCINLFFMYILNFSMVNTVYTRV